MDRTRVANAKLKFKKELTQEEKILEKKYQLLRYQKRRVKLAMMASKIKKDEPVIPVKRAKMEVKPERTPDQSCRTPDRNAGVNTLEAKERARKLVASGKIVIAPPKQQSKIFVRSSTLTRKRPDIGSPTVDNPLSPAKPESPKKTASVTLETEPPEVNACQNETDFKTSFSSSAGQSPERSRGWNSFHFKRQAASNSDSDEDSE